MLETMAWRGLNLTLDIGRRGDFGHRQAGRCIGHDNGLSGLMKCGQHLE